jgi:iron complex transport system substrate-binding protein
MMQERQGKICSLLPSATEIVFALGLDHRLVGVTHECDYPPAARQLPVVTRSILDHQIRHSRDIHRHISAALHEGSSLYVLDQGLLERLDPELILTQELCDVCAVSYQLVEKAVLRLQGKRRVLSLEPTSLGGILASIEQVADAADVPDRAATAVTALRRRIEVVSEQSKEAPGRPRVLALEWLDPLFTAGHWVPEMIRVAGGRDTIGIEGRPSAQIAWSRVIEGDPEAIVLMPCGFTLEQTLEEAARVRFVEEWMRWTGGKRPVVYAVNGSAYFNRPGPRIVDGLEILFEIVQPTLGRPRWEGTAWRRLPGSGP